MQSGHEQPPSLSPLKGLVTDLLMTVAAATQRDIDKLAERDSSIATCGLAALALALAREMDEDNSATSKSMCARALAETLDRLQAMAPAEEAADFIDELNARRAASAAR